VFSGEKSGVSARAERHESSRGVVFFFFERPLFLVRAFVSSSDFTRVARRRTIFPSLLLFEERSNNFPRCIVVVVVVVVVVVFAGEEERERTERGKKRTPREWIVDDVDVGAAERRFELRHERRRE
jgi:hypothetical protein